MTSPAFDPFGECTPDCAIPVPCPVCGRDLPPRGRAVALEHAMASCCEEHRYDAANTRHIWGVHELTPAAPEEECWWVDFCRQGCTEGACQDGGCCAYPPREIVDVAIAEDRL